MSNPYNSEEALKNSCYLRPNPEKPTRLMDALTGDNCAHQLALYVHAQFRAMVTGPAFPCVLGRSALNRHAYRFGFYHSMVDDGPVHGLCHDLWEFVQEQPGIAPNDFSTFVTCFGGPFAQDEKEYEERLWSLLQKLHEHDVDPWDPQTSSDPDDPRFSFSFAKRSYFVVGMHPMTSRSSRRFTYPTLVFNAHHQFDKLKEDGKFDSFQRTIRSLDVRLQGDVNPSLTNYGDDTEAKQYSGRLVEADWRVPFEPKGRD